MYYGSKIQITENTRVLDNQGKKLRAGRSEKSKKFSPAGKSEILPD